MKSLLLRSMVLSALLLACLPALAQRVRYENNGQADVTAVNLELVEAAVIRDVTGHAPENVGQIVFFRPDRPAANAAPVSVSENGADLHPLPGGSWFVAVVPPGIHDYSVGGRTITLEVKPGHCYYLRAAGSAERVQLSQSNAMVFLNATGSRPLPRL
jgi:hypothetical protein